MILYRKMFINLQQGKNLLEYNNDIKSIVKPQLKIIEGFESIANSSKNTVEHNDIENNDTSPEMTRLQEQETMFNKLLNVYSNLYQSFNEELLKRTRDKSIHSISPSDIDPEKWEKMNEVSMELNELSEDMIYEMDGLSQQNSSLKSITQSKKQQLKRQLHALEEENKQINNAGKNLVISSALSSDSDIQSTAFYYQLIIWFILAIMVIIVAMNTMSMEYIPSSTYIVLGLILLYIALKVYNKV